jgi:hypothetical protein
VSPHAPSTKLPAEKCPSQKRKHPIARNGEFEARGGRLANTMQVSKVKPKAKLSLVFILFHHNFVQNCIKNSN